MHGQTDGRTHNGYNAMTIARWSSAIGAKIIMETGENAG